MLSHAQFHELFMPSHTQQMQIIQSNHNWVSVDLSEALVWQLSYLGWASEAIPDICEIVVCLFFTNWLQLEIKQRESLPGLQLNRSQPLRC